LKIGLLIYGSLDNLTGGFIYDRYLVDYLKSSGDQIEIVSLPWRNYPLHLADNLSRSLRARLLDLEVDLLIQDELCHPSLFLTNSWIKAKVKYPLYALVHHLRGNEKHPVWMRWFYQLIERRYLYSIEGLVFNSKTTRASVEPFIPRLPPNVIAYPGGNRLGDSLSREHIRQRALENKPLRVCFLGSITRRKQPHLLIEACSLISTTKIEVTLIGSQDIEPSYARRVRKLIVKLPVAAAARMVQAINSNELSALLAKQDLLVVPSTYEGFGIVYLEGMAFGLPAIATTSGAAHETIRHNENGFLIDAGDSTALATHLLELANDRQKLLKLSLAALHTYQNGPTWEGMGQRVYEFLHSL